MSEPIGVVEQLGWVDRNIRGEEYIDFHKEPLVKIADQENKKYTELLSKMGKKDHINDVSYLTKLATQRKTVCESRLQAAKASKDKKLRDKSYQWEAEAWYTDIALETLDGKHKDNRVLRGVTRSMAGEMIQLDRDYTMKRKAEMSQGIIGEVKFENRVKEFVSLADAFIPKPAFTPLK